MRHLNSNFVVVVLDSYGAIKPIASFVLRPSFELAQSVVKYHYPFDIARCDSIRFSVISHSDYLRCCREPNVEVNIDWSYA